MIQMHDEIGGISLKLNGTFSLREIGDEIIAVPVGETALTLNGLIVLNPVSKVIWECLEVGADRDTILSTLIKQFDVEETIAKEDLESFLNELRKQNLMKEE